MREFKGKTAVITGGSSGIGLAIARRCIDEGMRVVLAGINANNLAMAETELRARGGVVLSVATDVSKHGDMLDLAGKTLAAFGGVDLLVNNAGVGTFSTIWESTLHDWQWVLEVNLWGMIHSLRTFVPIMLKQEAESHIVNVSSIAGLMAYPGMGIYKVTKASQVSISETLYYELLERGAHVGVSVVCPAFVKTNIMNSARNRPAELSETVRDEASEEWIRASVNAGLPPEDTMEPIFEGIRERRLYVFTHPGSAAAFRERFDTILNAADLVGVHI